MRLLYWRGKGPLAWVVRTITRSRWSHVAVSLEVYGLHCYLESTPFKGVRVVPVSLHPPDATQETGVELTHAQLRGLLVDLGQPYGYLDAIRAGLGLSPNHAGMECAELAIRALREGGASIDVIPTPEAVWRWVEEM